MWKYVIPVLGGLYLLILVSAGSQYYLEPPLSYVLSFIGGGLIGHFVMTSYSFWKGYDE